MAYSKIILNNETLMDVTSDTVDSGKLLYGETATKNSGAKVTGSIASKTSSDLTASGATVTAPAGYYASQATKSVSSGSASTPATTITANPTISVNSSTGLITATTSKTQSVTPTVSAGYVSSGTAGTITVSGSATNQLTTKAAATITPTSSQQTIASGRYLTGTQTIQAVTCSNLTAENIKDGVTVKVGTSTDDDSVTSVTGTYSGGGSIEPIVFTIKARDNDAKNNLRIPLCFNDTSNAIEYNGLLESYFVSKKALLSGTNSEYGYVAVSTIGGYQYCPSLYSTESSGVTIETSYATYVIYKVTQNAVLVLTTSDHS